MLADKRRQKHRRKFLALTGLTPKEFHLLRPACCEGYESVQAGDTPQSGRVRQRHVGGGRNGRLGASEQKLLFLLVDQQAYPLQTLVGEVFEWSQARVNYWGHHVFPLLHHTWGALELMPEREPHQFARQERTKQESPELILEGTERRGQRPKSPQPQARHYSGKPKTHSDKPVVVVHAKTKRVGSLSLTYAGKTHDQKIVDQEAIAYPRDAIWWKDTGFPGYEPLVRQIRQLKKSLATEPCPGERSGRIGCCRGSG